ncbi:MAG: carboxylesterase/lipase family protein [Janthinobacterium lividum]
MAVRHPGRFSRRHLLGATVAGAALSGARAQSRILDAPCGPLRGITVHSGLQAFLGIPYAEPPVGPLRYASPRPARRWTAVHDATRPGAASIQTLAGAAAWLYEGAEPQDENCLFLNVWTPTTDGQRPVMVWLHGGAWRTGRGNAAGTDGAALAARGDVVVVTVNYRLGALGWLAHPALRDPETGTFANWGLQDQLLALQWVQDNIAAFGGDPTRVTLYGQSAGGSSTASIAQDPRHRRLLQRAIIESGSLHGAPGFPEVPTAAAYADALAARLSVTVPGLRAVPALTLHRTELELARDPAMVRSLGRPPVLPVLDGAVLRVWPRDGVLAPVPLLIGSTRNEAVFWYDLVAPDDRRIPGLFPPPDRTALVTAIRDLAALYRPEAEAISPETVADAYAAAARGRGEPDAVLPVWLAVYTDVVFRLRARACARRHAEAGQPVFLYEFAHSLAPPAHGVPHTAEIPFVFGTYTDPFFAAKLGAGSSEAALSDAMLNAWARFAHDGTPGPGWADATAEMLPTNVLGGPAGVLAVEPHSRVDELTVWGMS